ncbi:MAG: serine/threonine protein kinase, partial [Pseudomonadota bacterium]
AQSGEDWMSRPDEQEESVEAIAAAVHADAPHLRLTQILGEGGMAVVFAGRHLTLDTPVAVKVARSAGPHRAELASRLIQEAKMYAALADAGAPRVLDARTLPGGTPYLVMERISGTVVADILERGPLEPLQALQILDGLLATLSALHAAGVVHRDVKPANIILEPLPSGGSRVRLIDFGVAKWGGGADGPFTMVADAKATQVGTLVGTPDYVAPEQILGGLVDGRADVYAAGATLFHMLTGKPPFQRATVHQSLAATLRDPLPRLASLRPGLPPALESLVGGALAREREHRTPSADAMRAALRAVLAGGTPSATVAPRTAPAVQHNQVAAEDTQSRMGAPRLRMRFEDEDDDLVSVLPQRRSGGGSGALLGLVIVGAISAGTWLLVRDPASLPPALARLVGHARGTVRDALGLPDDPQPGYVAEPPAPAATEAATAALTQAPASSPPTGEEPPAAAAAPEPVPQAEPAPAVQPAASGSDPAEPLPPHAAAPAPVGQPSATKRVDAAADLAAVAARAAAQARAAGARELRQSAEELERDRLGRRFPPPAEEPVVDRGYPLAPVLESIDAQLRGPAPAQPRPARGPTPLSDNPY